MSLVEQSLGQLARSIPGATQVFHEYELDFAVAARKAWPMPPPSGRWTPAASRRA